jgi:hypothetical protein
MAKYTIREVRVEYYEERYEVEADSKDDAEALYDEGLTADQRRYLEGDTVEYTISEA